MSIACRKSFTVTVRESTDCALTGTLVTPVNVRIVGYADSLFAGIPVSSCGQVDAWSNSGSMADWAGLFYPTTELSGVPYYYTRRGSFLYGRTNAADHKTISGWIKFDGVGAVDYGNVSGCGWLMEIFLATVVTTFKVWTGKKGYGDTPVGVFTRESGCSGFGPGSVEVESY